MKHDVEQFTGCKIKPTRYSWRTYRKWKEIRKVEHGQTEVFSSIFRSLADDCPSFLLLADILLIWPLPMAVVERSFSSINRVKKQMHSSMSQENMAGVLRIGVKFHPIPKDQRPQAFVNSGPLSKTVIRFLTQSIRPQREQWVETHPKARHWAGLPKKNFSKSS